MKTLKILKTYFISKDCLQTSNCSIKEVKAFLGRQGLGYTYATELSEFPQGIRDLCIQNKMEISFWDV